MERVEANGTSISFKRSGEGPPLFLLHGAEADHSMFDAFGAVLALHFTVIAYDQRDSGATRNPPVPYGLGELADDLAALIAALGYVRAHVFGTSFGGAIAQLAAVCHPARIDRLVLASTFRVGVSVASINPEGVPRFAELRARLPESLPAFAEYFFAPSYIAAHPEALALFTGNKRDTGQRERRGAVLGQPIEISLGAIKAPTLVLAGSEDRLIPPAHTQSLAREIPGVRSAVIEGIGHVGTIQDPAAVAAQVRAFLQSKN
ncbi:MULTISPECIES: alpha/beta fold hydrolase [unclassified Bradyrhizobium]|uniref:alpha/beta fold hydrolase n=1 Tax=unclassified Bradyrhizobium TaxID=2631580 RepID=UPI002479390C|nr:MULTISPECIES: alpha/beta fold hydrolase [unclassified Bradyrhizobium]WGS18837.1 alpha/beta hydrolase [Bradyrhizobium sp. ISRA463]WGS25665.1 alpha/beta hydrolase [Bradyrhizobium sp. ISRA464]